MVKPHRQMEFWTDEKLKELQRKNGSSRSTANKIAEYIASSIGGLMWGWVIYSLLNH
jgi:hypothetical protein